MPNLKRGATVVIEHDDLADILTDAFCGWPPFANMHVTLVYEKAGQFSLTLAPKLKVVAVVKPKEAAK